MAFPAGRLKVGALLTSIVGFCVIPVATRGGQPTAEQVLAAYAKAIGGGAATKVKTIAVDFRFSGGGLPRAMEGQGYIQPPDKNYLVIHLSSMGLPDYESGVNGDTAWRINPGTGYQLLEGVEKRMALRGTRLNSFEGWQKAWKSAQLAGEESVGGTSCHKLALTPPEGEPLTAHFDKRTGLLVQESISIPSTAPPLIVTTYSDYRDVGGGVLVAHRVEQTGPQPSVIEYTRVQLDAAVPAGRFELPEPVKDLLESQAEAAASEPRRSVQLGEIREVASKITHREYELIVNLPYSYARDRSKRYPVVYFTDGFYDFPLFAMIYGEQIYDRTLSECFMVGFSYKGKNADYERLRIQDYTPTKSAQYGLGGGAPEFLEVVEKEFIPFMEANYRVDPSWRALAGSSAGGLFALYAMLTKPQLFNAIVAVSPGVLWGDNWLFGYEEEFHAKAEAIPLSLYMTGAEKELPDQPAFLESIKRFDQVLKARRYEGLRYEFRLIDGARHSGSKPEGFSRGLQFIFEPRLAVGPGVAGTSTPEDVAAHISVQAAASVRVEADGKTVYFDPFFDEKTPAPAADLILITHGHDRHCSPATVARILKPETTIVAPEICARTLRETAKRPITTPVPGKITQLAGLTVEPVPAYTPQHADHPREAGGVGYVLTIGGVRVYHSGSTALVPELKEVRADVALLAFVEGYILSTQDAAELARSLGAKFVIPIHCKPEEAVKLRDALQPSIRVLIKG